MGELSYRTGDVQTKPPDDLVWTRFCDENNFRPHLILADEEYSVLHRQDPMRIGVEIIAYALFFLDDPRDRIDKKNEGAGAVRSVLLETAAAAGVAHSLRLELTHTSTGHP